MKTDLTTDELLLVNQEVALRKKDKTLVLILWFFTCAIGGHRFYLGNTGYAVLMLLTGWLTFFIWPLLDIFWALKEVDKDEARLRRIAIANVKTMRGGHHHIALHTNRKGIDRG